MTNFAIVNKAVQGIRKNSPKILMSFGILLGVSATVTACVATTKAAAIIDEHNKEMEEIEKARKICDPEEYTEKDIKHDKVIVFGHTIGKLIKLYALASILGIFSILSILFGFDILSKRLAYTSAALLSTLCSFDAYRSHVIEDQGEDKDRQYFLGSTIEKKAIEEEVIDPNTGKKKIVKKDAEIIDINIPDAAVAGIMVISEFNPDGSRNPVWDRDFDIMRRSLMAIQNSWNERKRYLETKGQPVCLNDIVVDCGGSWNPGCQIRGWNPGDGKCIDFGLDEWSPDTVRQYINGDIDCLILKFNIDTDPIIGTIINDSTKKIKE